MLGALIDCNYSFISTGSLILFFFFCIPYLNSMIDVKHSLCRVSQVKIPYYTCMVKNLFLAKTITEANLIKNYFFIVGFKTLHFEGGFMVFYQAT